MPKFDVIIVGAGITGLASAYHIKKNHSDLSVAILDMKSTYAQGNTAKSAAGFRDLFTSDINRKISGSSISFYRHVQKDLDFDLGMHFNGYLFLLDGKRLGQDSVKTFVQEKRARLVESDQIEELGFRTGIPGEEKEMMHLSDIDGGLLGFNCGIIEPDRICAFYESELRRLGAEFFYNTTVKDLRFQPKKAMNYPGEPFIWQEVALQTVNTNNGEFSAKENIFCTDVWTTRLLDSLGIDSHVRPKKRQVFQISGDSVSTLVGKPLMNDEKILPFTIFPSHGIAMRSEPNSRSAWLTVSDDYNRDFSMVEDPEPEADFYEKNIFPVVQAYLPVLSNSRVTSMWAGYYSYNTSDKTHYVFRENNLIVAGGSSGSGIMKADAIGRVVAALYSGKEKTSLYDGSVIETSDLGVERRNVPHEKMVI